MTEFYGSAGSSRRVIFRFALIVGLLQAMVSSASALVCPAPQTLARAGVLEETPAQIQALSNLLASGDEENRIAVTVVDLRARYPGVENAEIINYPITAECPVVAKLGGLGEQEKKARLDRFLREAAQIVYRH